MLNIIIWDPMGQEVFMYVYCNEKITSQGACIVNQDGNQFHFAVCSKTTPPKNNVKKSDSLLAHILHN